MIATLPRAHMHSRGKVIATLPRVHMRSRGKVIDHGIDITVLHSIYGHLCQEVV